MYFLSTSRQYNVVLPSQNRNPFIERQQAMLLYGIMGALWTCFLCRACLCHSLKNIILHWYGNTFAVWRRSAQKNITWCKKYYYRIDKFHMVESMLNAPLVVYRLSSEDVRLSLTGQRRELPWVFPFENWHRHAVRTLPPRWWWYCSSPARF